MKWRYEEGNCGSGARPTCGLVRHCGRDRMEWLNVD